jgi:hypothetical protein
MFLSADSYRVNLLSAALKRQLTQKNKFQVYQGTKALDNKLIN